MEEFVARDDLEADFVFAAAPALCIQGPVCKGYGGPQRFSIVRLNLVLGPLR